MMRGRSIPLGSGVLTISGIPRFSGSITCAAVTFAPRATVSPTVRQLALLRFVRGYQMAHGGVSPSYVEMAAGLGIDKSNVHRLVAGCVERGLLRRKAFRTRGLELLVNVPVPTAPDGAPLFFVPVASLSHEEENA